MKKLEVDAVGLPIVEYEAMLQVLALSISTLNIYLSVF
jgi:hypothetical protein